MNREILFRGQTRRHGEKVLMGTGEKLPGRWVYGGVLQGTGAHSIIYGGENVENPGEGLDKWVVYTDTVGQYTGKKIKGVKCFEGDVIFARYSRLLVKWDPDFCAWWTYYFNDRGHPCRLCPLHDISPWETSGIIGNIHDNPELLKEGDHDN